MTATGRKGLVKRESLQMTQEGPGALRTGPAGSAISAAQVAARGWGLLFPVVFGDRVSLVGICTMIRSGSLWDSISIG